MKLQIKNILQIASIILLVFSSWSLKAQTESIGKFSLKEAQNYALKNSYAVKGSDYDLKVAKKKVWETISTGLPQVKATADYTRNLSLAENILTITPQDGSAPQIMSVKMGDNYASNYGISLDQKIFDGSYIVGLAAAKVYVQLSKNTKEKSEIEVKNAVAQAYYNVLVAKENYKTIKENLEITKTTHHETKAYYENGFREELDVDQVLLMLKRSENQLSDAKRAISNSLIILKFAMGYDIGKKIELKNSLDNFVDPLRISKIQTSKLDLENHIDFKIIETQLKAQQLILRNEKAAFLPKIDAFYNYGKNTNSADFNVFKTSNPWFESSMIGLKMSMPIFTSGNTRSKINQEKVNYLKLETQKFETEQNLKKDVSLSFNSLVNAKENYENDLMGLEIAKRIYDKTRIKFNEGISSSTELSKNEEQYLNSHSAYIGSTLKLLNSKVAFDKALGKL